jgi:hypothetical protein
MEGERDLPAGDAVVRGRGLLEVVGNDVRREHERRAKPTGTGDNTHRHVDLGDTSQDL